MSKNKKSTYFAVAVAMVFVMICTLSSIIGCKTTPAEEITTAVETEAETTVAETTAAATEVETVAGTTTVVERFDGITLNWLGLPEPHYTGFEKAIKKWEDATGGKVNYQKLNGWPELYEKALTSFQSKAGAFDLVTVSNGWFPTYAPFLRSINLSEWSTKYNVPNDFFMESLIKDATIGSKLIVLPYNSETYLVYYRQDYLEKYGVEIPKTMSDLLTVAQKCNDPDNGIYGWGGMAKTGIYPYWQYNYFLRAMGGNIFDESGKPAMTDNQIALDALKFMQELYKNADPACLNWDHFNLSDNVIAGKVAIVYTHSGWCHYNYCVAPPEDVAANVDYEDTKPIVPPQDKQYGNSIQSWNIGLPLDSKEENVAAALSLLYYCLGTPEAQETMLLDSTGYFSSLTAVTDAVKEKFPYMDVVANAQNVAVSEPYTPQYMQMTEDIGTELSKVFSGAQTAEEALVAIDKKLNADGVAVIPKE